MEEKPYGQKPPRELGTNVVSKSFGVVMVVLYFLLGTTIIFKAPQMRNIPEHYAIVFGVILILYGVYRAYKLYRKYF